MKLILLLAFVATALAVQFRDDVIPKAAIALKGQAIVNYVNALKTTWTAELNTNTHRNLMNIKYTKHPEGVIYSETPSIDATIPATFDGRSHWSHCKSIGKIRDQSQCGGCWAFAATESLTDRICIASDGKETPELSSEDLLECCGSFCGYGCEGGYPIRAWSHMVSAGVCTGGGFYEKTGCKPYTASEPCGTHTVNGVTHHHDCTGEGEAKTPACHSSCTNSAYSTAYAKDKHYAKSSYAVRESVSAIQTEIMTNGPVEAAFTVYEDFDHYKSGVYTHKSGKELGGHAVKIIGWGTESGTAYWLVANSWNTNWGEQGFFKIKRGANECGIEEAITAGLAKV